MLGARLAAPALAGMLWLLAVMPAAAGTRVASVRFIVHGLGVQTPGKPLSQARLRQPLFASDRLLTRTGQRASVTCLGQSVLYINQRTDLVLRSATVVELRGGEVAVNDHGGSHISIRTGTAVAASIGTRYNVRIETASTPRFPSGTTTISVVTGLVRVSNRFASVLVHPSEWTHVPPGRAPTRPTHHNAARDLSWTAGLP